MNIGIDIDDTIADSFETIFADSQKFDIELGYSGNVQNYGKVINHDEIENLYTHWTKEQINLFWNKYFIKVLTEANPKKYAVETINKLKSEGNKIYIITSRYEEKENSNEIENYTKEWLEKNNICYDELIMNVQNKLEVCKKYNVNLFIDNSIAHCKRVQEGNIKSLVYTTICNQDVNLENLERVYSWPQIYRIYNLQKIHNNNIE